MDLKKEFTLIITVAIGLWINWTNLFSCSSDPLKALRQIVQDIKHVVSSQASWDDYHYGWNHSPVEAVTKPFSDWILQTLKSLIHKIEKILPGEPHDHCSSQFVSSRLMMSGKSWSRWRIPKHCLLMMSVAAYPRQLVPPNLNAHLREQQRRDFDGSSPERSFHVQYFVGLFVTRARIDAHSLKFTGRN